MAIDGMVSRNPEQQELLLAERFAADTRAPARARHFVARALDPQAAGSGDILLMVSELVTNACVHAGSDITLQVRAGPDSLRVEVGDKGGLPPVLEEWNGRVGGLGLQLVDHLADRWGWQPASDGGKVVWFEQRTRVAI
jgi:anti-sigma regulatory factor (Ser/Thr protein kinase)